LNFVNIDSGTTIHIPGDEKIAGYYFGLDEI